MRLSYLLGLVCPHKSRPGLRCMCESEPKVPMTCESACLVSVDECKCVYWWDSLYKGVCADLGSD